MSEFQHVHFLAIDRPLDDEQLAFMQKQSSRAEVTRWEFTNEYHYGDFHGKTEEMLRRGFDVHLHFADFGIRCLMFRLPGGMPWEGNVLKAFRPKFGVEWIADKIGPGGILKIHPDSDGERFLQYVEDIEELIHAVAPVRALLLNGDLRPLYIAWLASSPDDDAIEPPVPAGMKDLPAVLIAMANFFEVDGDLLNAAAEASLPAPKTNDASAITRAWLDDQSLKSLRSLVERFLTEDSRAVCAEVQAQLRAESPRVSWPTTVAGRTVGQLRELAETVASRRRQREKEVDRRRREKELRQIAQKPDETIAKVLKLAHERSGPSYTTAVHLLIDLREALGSEAGSQAARITAEQLQAELPRAHQLIRELREANLLPAKRR